MHYLYEKSGENIADAEYHKQAVKVSMRVHSGKGS